MNASPFIYLYKCKICDKRFIKKEQVGGHYSKAHQQCRKNVKFERILQKKREKLF